jgi:hypothetical protein
VNRVAAILNPLQGQDAESVFPALCRGCVEHFDISGAALILIVDAEQRGTLGASDPTADAIEELQFSLGDGPALDAWRSSRLVSEPQLSFATRWPAFAAAASALGVQSMVSVPLRSGAARFGVLDVLSDRPGPLRPRDLEYLCAVADAATVLVLALQAEVPVGALSSAFSPMIDRRAVIHQAAGMVAVQLDVKIEDALVALRARAYQREISPGDLADEIVARRVRLDGPP